MTGDGPDHRWRLKPPLPVRPLMPRKDLGCVQSVPLLLEEEDRVNAELQRAPAVSEMRQVGVPALAGLSAKGPLA